MRLQFYCTVCCLRIDQFMCYRNLVFVASWTLGYNMFFSETFTVVRVVCVSRLQGDFMES